MTVTFKAGRMRARLHLLFVLLMAAAGWLWFGNAGAALMLLWGKASQPAEGVRRREVRLERIGEIRLYARALVVKEYRGSPLWIFADEMPAAEFAHLRRVLKAQIEGLI